MKRVVPFLALACLIAACQDASITRPPDVAQYAVAGSRPLHQVIGAGTVVFDDQEGAPRATYSFHAQADAFGNASGEAEVHFATIDATMHIDIQCLAVAGNDAWLSGSVTRSSDPARPVGRVYLWRVLDSGEGEGAGPDGMSSFVYMGEGNFSPDVCRWMPLSMTTRPWTNGNVKILTHNAITLADLVGTWDATRMIYINQADPADTLDIIAAGAAYRMTIAPNGRFTMLWWLPAVPAMFENSTGSIDVVDGRVQVIADGDPDPASLGYAARFGNVLYLQGEVGHDWNGDGNDDEPSDVYAELRLKRTGVLIGDLAGTWDATSWRYTNVASPAVTVDLVADAAVAVVLTLGLDGHWTLAFTPGDSSEGDLLVEGDLMLTRTESREGSPPVVASAFTFLLDRSAWSFTGLAEYDFDGDPDTPAEPAMLAAVMIRH